MSAPEQLSPETREGRAAQYLAELAARVAQADHADGDAQVHAEVTTLINAAKSAASGTQLATGSETSQ